MALQFDIHARAETTLRPVPFAILGTPVGAEPPPAARPQPEAALLRDVPLFRGLDAETAQWLLRHATLRRVARNTLVIEQGSREHNLHVLIRGHAQVLRHNQRGRSLVLDQLRPGDHFGEASLIDDQPQFASVRCTVPSDVLVIARADLLDCLHDCPPLMAVLLQMTVDRVRRRNRRIALLALHDVRGCVVQQLLDLAELHDGVPVVRGRISRQAVADMIGASRAMVSRVMMSLLRSGEIELLPDGSTAVHCTPSGSRVRRLRRHGDQAA